MNTSLVFQFVLNITTPGALADELKAFPVAARRVLDTYDTLLLSGALASDSIQFVIANLEKLQHFAFLLGSTMIFPQIKDRVMRSEAPGITTDRMANETIPRLLSEWNDVATQIITGNVNTGEIEGWFRQLIVARYTPNKEGALPQPVSECKQHKQTITELQMIEESMEDPGAAGTIETRLDSFIFLRNSRQFVFDFHFLVNSIQNAGKFNGEGDDLWSSLCEIVETLQNDYAGLTLASIGSYEAVLVKMRVITARMDDDNKQFIEKLNDLEREHGIIGQMLTNKKYKFIVKSEDYAKFAGVFEEAKDNYDKMQVRAFENFNVIRGLLCNVLAPENPFENLDAFLEIVQVEVNIVSKLAVPCLFEMHVPSPPEDASHLDDW